MAVEDQQETFFVDTNTVLTDASNSLKDQRIAFVGKLGGINRREAKKFVREKGGQMVDSANNEVDLIVIGADELPSNDYEQLLADDVISAAAHGHIEIINETEFWIRAGVSESEDDSEACRLYTPALLADLLNVKISTIRRWHRRGLIQPTKMVNRLPYFDFHEVSSARRIARLIESGKSPQVIEAKLQKLAELSTELERPLSQLSIIVEGRSVLLRKGEGLIEPGGQKRIDFDAISEDTEQGAGANDAILNLEDSCNRLESLNQYSKPEDYLELANEFEDLGEPDSAIHVYRSFSLAFGPNPEVNFRLAELLYLKGEYQAARERYYLAVEMDETYVEARASLGCVLVELGQPEMAVSAFNGALDFHNDYPDVHFHLARLLDDLDQPQNAVTHWQRFLELAPKSPWADEARDRLHQINIESIDELNS